MKNRHLPLITGTHSVKRKLSLFQDPFMLTSGTYRESKVRTYKLLEENRTRVLVNYKNVKQRNAVARLRTSAHRLAIEQGRYKRPPVPISEALSSLSRAKD